MEMLMFVLVLILFFAPYLVVPIALGYRNINRSKMNVGFPFLTTALILFIWPFAFFWFSEITAPYDKPRNCYTGEAGFIVLNVVFLIPISLLIQFIGIKVLKHNNVRITS
ncbi:hypothetical protein [Pedobacter paludis]|uniref:Uncharacterized protein n=1 Tax=Pedobacter paludis TaxID=2203212 RepID=A0A317EZY7_9SPHI|nr:hypothetical protein [Pedobacter paludis]PWS32042.1 hypothetical protein DF947_09685 [Pedobacter paludis]